MIGEILDQILKFMICMNTFVEQAKDITGEDMIAHLNIITDGGTSA